MADPFTETYSAIRAAFIAWAPLAGDGGLVKPGNLPDYSAKDPYKSNITPADLPELVLTQSAFRIRPYGRNSLTTTIEQSYPVVMSAHTLKLPPINAVKYELCRALLAAPDKFGLSYILDWNISTGSDEVAGNPEAMRGGNMRVSVAQINVEMALPRKTILSL